jgi:DNA-binding transcriptional LysR family regulator
MISHGNLSRLDLNLLVALDALLTERHVTRAAERLGIGQSAMSQTLAKLRLMFADELLVRSGPSMQPTPKALAIGGQVRHMLEQAQQLLASHHPFQAISAVRTFRLCLSDGLELILGPLLARRLCDEAPSIGLEVHNAELGRDLTLLDDDTVDLCVGVFSNGATHHKSRVLCTSDAFVCVYHPDRVRLKAPVSLEDFVAYAHVGIASNLPETEPIDEALKRRGLARNVKLTTPHALVIPHILSEAPLFAVLPGGIARASATRFGLAISPLPVTLPARQIMMAWHSSYEADPGHAWLRDFIYRTAKQVAELEVGSPLLSLT